MKRMLSVMVAVFLTFSAVFIVPVSAAYENTYKNTGNQIEDLIGVARTQIGYKEGPSASQMDGDTYDGDYNYTKYGAWYGINPGAWCAMFVSWCANQAGIPTSVIPKHASCDAGMNFFKNQGRWGWGKYWGNYQGKTVYTPVRGDIVYFGSGNLEDSTHVGIVYAVDASYIYTIEGNTSNRCAYKQHAIGDSYIYGYGRPAYSGSSDVPAGESTLTVSGATYPSSLTVGQSFGIHGTVTSNYNIVWVRSAVYNSSGTLTISSYKTPGSKSFSITEINPYVKFGSLSAGRYVYCIEATDASGIYKMLLMQPFSVGSTSQSQPVFSYKVNTTTANLNMRSGIGTSYPVVGSLPIGATIQVQKIQDDWAYTTYNGVSGWCSMEYLKINYTPKDVIYGNSPTPSPTQEPTPSPTQEPTPSPTQEPTPSPTQEPTPSPTQEPTPSPTQSPTPVPVQLIFRSKPTKLYYEAGEALDLTGLALDVKLSDGTRLSLSEEELEISGYDSALVGKQKICILYQNVTNSFTVEVRDVPQEDPITSLLIRKKPDKIYYNYREPLDLTGLQLCARYASGKISELSEGDYTVSGFDSEQVGKQAVVLTCQGVRNTFTIEVLNTVTGLSLNRKPDKLYYQYGEDLDLTGLEINVRRADGTWELWDGSRFTVSGYESTLPGNQQLRVSLDGYSVYFTVNVSSLPAIRGLSLRQKPDQLYYQVGEELDLSGLKVVVLYGDGSERVLMPEELSVTGYLKETLGNQRITVHYMNYSSGFTVNVYR